MVFWQLDDHPGYQVEGQSFIKVALKSQMHPTYQKGHGHVVQRDPVLHRGEGAGAARGGRVQRGRPLLLAAGRHPFSKARE